MISKQNIFSNLKKMFGEVNQNNINKTLDVFNESVQNFGDSMNKITHELNQPQKNKVKIWSDKEENNSSKSKDQINLEKIWGKKNDRI